jgi:hypothetical protein
MEGKPRTKDLPDISEANLAPGSFITVEQLVANLKINKQFVRSALAKNKVWPVAKAINRDASGKMIGGSPSLVFNIDDANSAIEMELENIL